MTDDRSLLWLTSIGMLAASLVVTALTYPLGKVAWTFQHGTQEPISLVDVTWMSMSPTDVTRSFPQGWVEGHRINVAIGKDTELPAPMILLRDASGNPFCALRPGKATITRAIGVCAPLPAQFVYVVMMLFLPVMVFFAGTRYLVGEVLRSAPRTQSSGSPLEGRASLPKKLLEFAAQVVPPITAVLCWVVIYLRALYVNTLALQATPLGGSLKLGVVLVLGTSPLVYYYLAKALTWFRQSIAAEVARDLSIVVGALLLFFSVVQNAVSASSPNLLKLMWDTVGLF